MSVALETIVKELSDSGIIASGKLAEFVPPKSHPTGVEELVAALVRYDHLTEYQAREVAAGRARSLIVGGYVVLDRISAGGMGQVFKARHRRMDRVVAIKKLPPDMNGDNAAIARFEREVHAAAKLFHPNIVTALDADEADGEHFLVMEYVAGRNLSATVKQDGALSVAQAVSYVLQAARGLAYAHGEGVVHRDIKPGNLVVDKNDVVKVLDMGLARIATVGNAATQAELTGSNAIMGTVDYMSPEQARSTHGVDGRADIYSLGCTLYYLLAAKPMYAGESMIEKALAHREQPIPSLRVVRADVPEELDAVFHKMVAKRIVDRYQTMTEVVEALEERQSTIVTTPLLRARAAAPTAEIAADYVVGHAADAATDRGLRRSDTETPASIGKGVSPLRTTQPGILRGRRAAVALLVLGAPAAIFTAVFWKPQSKLDDSAAASSNAFFTAAPNKNPVTLRSQGPSAASSVSVPDPLVPRAPVTDRIVPKPAISVPSGDIRPPIDREDEVARWVISRGGFVYVAVKGVLSEPIRGIARLPQEKFELRVIDLERTNYGEPDFERLSGLPNLVHLSLDGRVVSDKWIRMVETLPRLTKLAIAGTRVSDAGFISIGKVPTLEILHAPDHDAITDIGIKHLRGLSKLQEINLVDTKVTAAGLADLPPSVKFLQLNAEQFKGLSPIEGLTDLCVYRFDDACREHLVQLKLKNLKSFLFIAAPNADPLDLASLQRAYPDCSIRNLAEPNPVVAPAVGSALSISPVHIASPARPKRLAIAGRITTFEEPEFIAWQERVEQLPAQQQIEMVLNKLVELNPGFDGKVLERNTTIFNGRVQAFAISTDHVTDISPVRAFYSLESLLCVGGNPREGILSDLGPLQGMKLKNLHFQQNRVTDLAPLKGMPLTALDFTSNEVSSLVPIVGMPLRSLNCLFNKHVTDLEPIRECLTLQNLNLTGTGVVDLKPIEKLNVTSFFCGHTGVTDLRPLEGMPLKSVMCTHAPISDLTPLLKSPDLKSLEITATKVSPEGIAALKKVIPKCRVIWEGDPRFPLPLPMRPATK